MASIEAWMYYKWPIRLYDSGILLFFDPRGLFHGKNPLPRPDYVAISDLDKDNTLMVDI